MGRKKSPSTIAEALQDEHSRFDELLEEYENSFTSEYLSQRVKKIRKDIADNVRVLCKLSDVLSTMKSEVVVITNDYDSNTGQRKLMLSRASGAWIERITETLMKMDMEGKSNEVIEV